MYHVVNLDAYFHSLPDFGKLRWSVEVTSLLLVGVSLVVLQRSLAIHVVLRSSPTASGDIFFVLCYTFFVN